MKKLITVTLTSLFILLLISVGHTAQLFSEEAIATARSFAQTIDSGNYTEAYAQASPILRLAQDKQDFTLDMERGRALLGPVQQRRPTALRSIGNYPRLPDGNYLIVQFEARTTHKNEATEIILLQQNNGVWQVADYSIR